MQNPQDVHQNLGEHRVTVSALVLLRNPIRNLGVYGVYASGRLTTWAEMLPDHSPWCRRQTKERGRKNWKSLGFLARATSSMWNSHLKNRLIQKGTVWFSDSISSHLLPIWRSRQIPSFMKCYKIISLLWIYIPCHHVYHLPCCIFQVVVKHTSLSF